MSMLTKKKGSMKNGEKSATFKILELLSKHEEFEQCKMAKATNLTYKTIVKALKKLREQESVFCIRTEPSGCRGKEKKIWALTSKGFLNSLENLPFEIFVKELSRRNELKSLYRRIEQWRLEETPKLAQEIIKRDPSQLYDSSFNDERIEEGIADLLLLLTFWDDFKVEDNSVYAQDMANRTPEDPQMRREAEVFLKNNPWMKRRISSRIDVYLKAAQHELDFMTNISGKWEKLL